MQAQIEKLVEAIVADYAGWSTRSKKLNDFVTMDVDENVREFAEKITVKPGKKYIKIITDHCVWGFVMADDDGKFRKGDILKAASWRSPARNAARGNIFEDYSVAWTGPHYLK